MKRTRYFCPLFGKIALLVCTVGIFARPLAAQTTYDFKIMVNGPWVYVSDPKPENDPYPDGQSQRRIVLVSPQSLSHKAYAFPGDDARRHGNPGDELKETGRYYFDFQKGARTFKGSRKANEPPPEAYPEPQVDDPTIDGVLFHPDTYKPGMPRFVISLPRPDYYSTYAGPYGSGKAESKLDSVHITRSTPAKDYTVWMVLHYQISTSMIHLIKNKLADSGSTEVNANFPQNQDVIAISIAMAPHGVLSQRHCDSYSIDSSSHSAMLWGWVQYVRFPEESDDIGTQHRGYYNYDCPDTLSAAFTKAQQAFEAALAPQQLECARERITNLREQLNELVKSKDLLRQKKNEKPERQKKANNSAECKELSNQEQLEAVRQEVINLSFGRLPTNIKRDLDCAKDLVTKEQPPLKCPGEKQPGPSLVNRLFDSASHIIYTAVGGTDCHMAQTSVDGAIQ